uniref:restriction endonuclease subunit S n=1 Tax=Bernardetia sp. TaxID=1937974 RepID=UPI0025BC94CA
LIKTENIKKYPAYKSSGVEWIGEVPEHWEVMRLGNKFKERRTKVSDKDFPPLSVTKNGIVPQLATAAKSKDGDNRKLVRKGDFVINSRSDRKGSSGIAFEDGSVSLINIVMQPKGISPIFCNYLLKGYSFIEEFYRMGHGIVADLWTTRYDEMKNIKVAIPPLSEQTQIANFLDKKTKDIDIAIAQKQQLISLLEERKQIIIQDAVTKGIDKTAKLKESGIEWIGKIPEHWEVKRLKYFSSLKARIGFHGLNSSDFTDEGEAYCITGTDFKDGKIDFKDCYKVSEYWYKMDKNIQVANNDLLVTKDGTIGKTAIVSNLKEKATLNSGVFLLRTIEEIFVKYLYWSLNSKLFTSQIDIVSRGSTIIHLYERDFKNFLFLVPPLSEQKQIVSHIESASKKIDKAISLQKKQIKKLKEYKSVLIDAAVTGKIKVSE